MNVIQSSGVSALVLSLLTTTTPFAADLSTKSSPPDTKVYLITHFPQSRNAW